MTTVFLLVLGVGLPTGLGYCIVGSRRLYAVYQNSRPPLPRHRSIERISADLRRLHEQLDEIENAPSDVPAKNHRCVATRAAYVDALTAACEQLELAAPAGRPVPDAEIFRVELELRGSGLDVRSPA